MANAFRNTVFSMNRNAVSYHSPRVAKPPWVNGIPLVAENPVRVPYSMQPLQGWDLYPAVSQGSFATLGFALERRWRSLAPAHESRNFPPLNLCSMYDHKDV